MKVSWAKSNNNKTALSHHHSTTTTTAPLTFPPPTPARCPQGHLCELGRPHGAGPCQHVQSAQASAARHVDNIYDQCAAWLVAIGSHVFHCPAAKCVLANVIEELSVDINAAVVNNDVGFDTDALKHAREQRGGGSRVDGDYKKQLRQQILQGKKCHNQMCVARLDGIDEGSARQWVAKDMRIFLNTTVRSLGQAGTRGPMILKLDGARVGQPAKETIHFVLRHTGSALSFYLTPQAGCGKHFVYTQPTF